MVKEQVIKLITDNMAAVFALAGVLVGGLISFVGSMIVGKKELKLRLWEKVIDRRIAAHEGILEFSKSLRAMISLGYAEEDGDLARFPRVMETKQNFEQWFNEFSGTLGLTSSWLGPKLTRELNLLTDYLVNLYEYLRKVDEKDYPKVGAILRYDFIDFSSKIEQMAFEFFRDELSKLKLNPLQEWHKYPKEETTRRLSVTALSRRHHELAQFQVRETDS